MRESRGVRRHPVNWAQFDTTLGRCGIAWSARGVSAVQLPERSEQETRMRLLRTRPEATEAPPPPDITEAITSIAGLLGGGRNDLSHVRLDPAGLSDFDQRVYAIARTIPPGQTLTYGDVARRLGDVGLSRAVGQALGRNPYVLIVPCHRVLAAGRKIGGFSAAGGTRTKLDLLSIEGVELREPDLFD
jgi:methylated-DNA-[protein]-cysteine S-methyltransferase